MEFARSRGQWRIMSLTALIDVVFLLLLFFLLTSSFVKSESMEITLPAGAVEAAGDEKPLVIVVAERGRVFVDNEKMESARLQDAVVAALRPTPERRVVVMNTEGVKVQELITVMDAVYRAGGKNVSLSSWSY